jgi:hypothetical protein
MAENSGLTKRKNLVGLFFIGLDPPDLRFFDEHLFSPEQQPAHLLFFG